MRWLLLLVLVLAGCDSEGVVGQPTDASVPLPDASDAAASDTGTFDDVGD